MNDDAAKRVYEDPQQVSEKEVLEAIKNDDVERLRSIPIELGLHHENWKFIQDISIRLSDHPDMWVRHNALRAIEYAARFCGEVEKNVVKPVLLRGLKDPEPMVADNAQDVIDELNHLTGWRIGGARRRKELERKFEAKRTHDQEKNQER